MAHTNITFLLAPLVVPLLCSAALVLLSPGQSPLTGFLFFLAIGSAISYGATFCLLLPTLYLISRFTTPTFLLTSVAGAVLGMLAWLPVAWVSYCASGVDSGPPVESFAAYLLRQFPWPDFWRMLVAGCVTAMLYRYLARRLSKGSTPPVP
jgi:membrane protein required for beta-lactamase induction